MTNNEMQLRLELAPDAAEADSYWYVLADGGEECYLCGRILEAGEMYDRLFVMACEECMTEIDKLNAEKKERDRNGT